MTYYTVISAIRIQSWISRTTDLKLVRGSSRALSRLTAASAVQPLADRAHLKVSDEAPDIDGVVVFESADKPSDVTVRALMRELSACLPGVEWQAWMNEDDSYPAARAGYDKAVGEGGDLPTWRQIPSAAHVPLLAPCQGCYQETAIREEDVNGVIPLGPDCLVRLAYAPNKPEPQWPRPAWDFTELARKGGEPASHGFDEVLDTLGRRDGDNHLCTIAADGNLVGDFFKKVAQSDLRPADQAGLSRAVEEATSAALTAAASQWPDAGIEAHITHYVGGDDILASVSARCAWQFAIELGHTFETEFAARVAQVLGTQSGETKQQQAIVAAARATSLGIGMAFTHHKHPFSEGRRLAELAEKQAKRAVQGKQGAIAWVDATIEEVLPSDRFITVEDARDQLTEHQLATMPSAARATLGSLLRLTAAEAVAKGEEADRTRNAILDSVARWVLRTGHKDLLDRYMNDQGPGMRRLTHDLDRVRWWPAYAKEATT